MRTRRRLAIIVALAAPAWLLAGCTGSSSGSPSPTTTTTSTSSASATTGSPEDQAKTEVLALVTRYYKTVDDLFDDPSTQLNSIYAVAAAPEATIQLNAVREFRLAGYKQSGETKLVSSSVTSVNLSSDTGASPPVRPTIKVTACVDVSGVRATDRHGKSVVPKNRKRYLISQLTVVKFKQSDDKAWSVTNAPNQASNSCDA